MHLAVVGNAGKNTLTFLGTGVSDGYGLTIDNVKLIKNGDNSKDFVVNGGFEKPDLMGKWKVFDRIEGWAGN